MAAPIPREPPVTSATLPASGLALAVAWLGYVHLLVSDIANTNIWELDADTRSATRSWRRLLEGAADRLSDKRNPTGCLLVQGALSAAGECEAVKRDLAARRAASEVLIRERLKHTKREGGLPPNADPATLARFVTTIVQGMSVQAAGGAGRKELRAIADAALRAWPV
jgi:hypothetical protein